MINSLILSSSVFHVLPDVLHSCRIDEESGLSLTKLDGNPYYHKSEIQKDILLRTISQT